MNVFVALVPEAPTNLQLVAESTTSIRVTWDSPEETNGPIVTYKVGLLYVALSLAKEVMSWTEFVFVCLFVIGHFVDRLCVYVSSNDNFQTK